MNFAGFDSGASSAIARSAWLLVSVSMFRQLLNFLFELIELTECDQQVLANDDYGFARVRAHHAGQEIGGTLHGAGLRPQNANKILALELDERDSRRPGFEVAYRLGSGLFDNPLRQRFLRR